MLNSIKKKLLEILKKILKKVIKSEKGIFFYIIKY